MSENQENLSGLLRKKREREREIKGARVSGASICPGGGRCCRRCSGVEEINKVGDAAGYSRWATLGEP